VRSKGEGDAPFLDVIPGHPWGVCWAPLSESGLHVSPGQEGTSGPHTLSSPLGLEAQLCPSRLETVDKSCVSGVHSFVRLVRLVS
jgi:hypothetical protein